MPDRDPEAPQNARLLTALIWAGVGLAPIAALVVLLGGSDNSVRFAVLLVAVSVVLIGAALLVRNDPVLLKMDVEEQVEALREELREEITASAHAAGNRVRALQDEMTRLRAAGSPAAGLPPAAARAAAPAGGYPVGGRAGVATPARTEPGQVSGGRPAVATASVAPPGGHTAVARIPAAAAAAAPVTGSASVGSAAVRPVSTGFAATGSAAVAAAPRQRGAAVVPPESGGYPGGYGVDDRNSEVAGPRAFTGYGADDSGEVSGAQAFGGYGVDDSGEVAGPQAFGGYGPGLSGSAWAERSGATEYPAGGYGAGETAPPAEQKPSRRHAAPDTGTDLARYGLGPAATPPAQSYGTAAAPQSYGAAAAPRTYGAAGSQTYGAEYGFDQSGGYDYADPAQSAPSAYGIETSSFFAEAEAEPEAQADNGGNARAVYGNAYADDNPGYGPDPQHGWAPRSQEQPGRW